MQTNPVSSVSVHEGPVFVTVTEMITGSPTAYVVLSVVAVAGKSVIWQTGGGTAVEVEAGGFEVAGAPEEGSGCSAGGTAAESGVGAGCSEDDAVTPDDGLAGLSGEAAGPGREVVDEETLESAAPSIRGRGWGPATDEEVRAQAPMSTPSMITAIPERTTRLCQRIDLQVVTTGLSSRVCPRFGPPVRVCEAGHRFARGKAPRAGVFEP
jgi:hypothetical protein